MTKYIKGLDSLRAFAVFFVLMEHKGVWFDDTVTNGRFIKEVVIPDGGFGVMLFFVLSGFLITSILLGEKQKAIENDRGQVIKNFFARRALRIFPIYYLLLAFLYAIDHSQIRQYIGYHATYTTNMLCYQTNQWNSFSHAWSLSVEEQFYLIWPWFIIFIRQPYLKYVFGVAIATGVISTWYTVGLKDHIGPMLVCNCFDSFGLGGLLAYVLPDNQRYDQFKKNIKWFVLAALSVYLYWKMGAFLHLPTYGLFLIKTVYSLLALWIIMAVINARPSLFKRYFLESRPLMFIGRISYGIYLYHYVYNGLVYYQLNDHLDRITTGNPALNKLVTDHHFYYWLHFALIILIATLSFYCIEKPFLNLKKRFVRKDIPALSTNTAT